MACRQVCVLSRCDIHILSTAVVILRPNCSNLPMPTTIEFDFGKYPRDGKGWFLLLECELCS